MSVQEVRNVFKEKVAPFGAALTGIYVRGGLMAHHDGVNSAVESFWEAAEMAISSTLSAEEKTEIENMYCQVQNLTFNAHTRPAHIVGDERYEALVNAL